MIAHSNPNLREKFVDQTAARLYALSKEKESKNVPYAGVVFDINDVRESVGGGKG